MTQASVPAKTTPYTISNPFAPTEMEKFFAHLNNGEVVLVEESRWEEREKELRDISGGVMARMEHLSRYRIIISPKAGE